jgi:acetolactate synthase-1/2/3 large subunit
MSPLSRHTQNQVDVSPITLSGTEAQVIVSAFHRHGVETIFGRSIPTQIHLCAATIGITQVGFRNEKAGAMMADGYA